MKRPVKLSEIIDGMESQTDETRAYLNKETGEIVCISDEEFSAAEEKRSLESYPEWQRGLIHEAVHVLGDDKGRYVALPSRFDIDEYRMMERFALSADDEKFSSTSPRKTSYWSSVMPQVTTIATDFAPRTCKF